MLSKRFQSPFFTQIFIVFFSLGIISSTIAQTDVEQNPENQNPANQTTVNQTAVNQNLTTQQAPAIQTTGVTLTESTHTFTHWQYTTNPDNTLASVDYNRLDSTTYQALIIENQFLRVTLVPEFGGRIVSIFNKSTQHEELFENPVGSPYLNGTNTFYYNWLMVFGGIFPTFSESEHGKTWLLPWNVSVEQNDGDTVQVRMSFVDNFDFPGAPAQFTYGQTNIICSFTVTLRAGRTAVETQVDLENPNNAVTTYEYWTNTAFAPGSEPGGAINTFLTSDYQIIAQINQLQPRPGGFGGSFGILDDNLTTALDWDFVQFFRNHQTDGTQYPEPNYANSNFWGGINQGNEEGFFRVANNELTPGLKIFSFGFQNTVNQNPEGPADNENGFKRPAVEMWAGTSNVFFDPAQLAANSTLSIPATYSPSVGMDNVTHASSDILANLTNAELELFFMTPVQNYRVRVESNGTSIFDEIVTPDPINGNRITGDFSNASQLTIINEQLEEVLSVQL